MYRNKLCMRTNTASQKFVMYELKKKENKMKPFSSKTISKNFWIFQVFLLEILNKSRES